MSSLLLRRVRRVPLDGPGVGSDRRYLLAARPPAGKWTFGWKRAGILSADANGITLLVVTGFTRADAILAGHHGR